MFYEEYEPCRELRAWIKCFWALEYDYSRVPGAGERVWPDGHYELIFTSGTRYALRTDNGPRRLPERFLIGLQTRPLDLHSDGVTRVLGVRFHAWGFAPFLDATGARDNASPKLSQYSNRVLDADSFPDVWTVWTDTSHGELVSGEAATRLERPLRERARGPCADSLAALMAREIVGSSGSVAVGELAASHGMSVRQAQRVFTRDIGVSPKTLARIVRFDVARRRINDRPDLSLTAIAHECGYSDHPHFARDFRELFGITPKDHRARVNAARADRGAH